MHTLSYPQFHIMIPDGNSHLQPSGSFTWLLLCILIICAPSSQSCHFIFYFLHIWRVGSDETEIKFVFLAKIYSFSLHLIYEWFRYRRLWNVGMSDCTGAIDLQFTFLRFNLDYFYIEYKDSIRRYWRWRTLRSVTEIGWEWPVFASHPHKHLIGFTINCWLHQFLSYPWVQCPILGWLAGVQGWTSKEFLACNCYRIQLHHLRGSPDQQINNNFMWYFTILPDSEYAKGRPSSIFVRKFPAVSWFRSATFSASSPRMHYRLQWPKKPV